MHFLNLSTRHLQFVAEWIYWLLKLQCHFPQSQEQQQQQQAHNNEQTELSPTKQAGAQQLGISRNTSSELFTKANQIRGRTSLAVPIPWDLWNNLDVWGNCMQCFSTSILLFLARASSSGLCATGFLTHSCSKRASKDKIYKSINSWPQLLMRPQHSVSSHEHMTIPVSCSLE